jgi:type II secretory pathway pseudopilin PulG
MGAFIMKSFAKRKDGGFTLIETVLIIVVLGIASYGVLTVFISGLSKSAAPVLGVQGIELAKEKLEMIMADKHYGEKGYGYLIPANYPAEAPVSGFSDFNRSVTFLEVGGADLKTLSPGSGFMRVSVTVSWVGDSVTLETVTADY